jgi:hypothetical protein
MLPSLFNSHQTIPCRRSRAGGSSFASAPCGLRIEAPYQAQQRFVLGISEGH